MNNNQMFEMIQRYAQEGRDIDAFISDYGALMAAGKTPIGLNQWVKTDKPMMEDFNEDNRVIDAAIRGLQNNTESLDTAMQALGETKVNAGAPVKHNLILNQGFTVMTARECVYSKNAFHEVTVDISVAIDAGKIASGAGATVTTLPVGFRPSSRRDVILQFTTANGANGTWGWGYGHILADGPIVFAMFSGQTALNTVPINTVVQFRFYAE